MKWNETCGLCVIGADKLQRTASRVQIVQQILQRARAEIIGHVDSVHDGPRRRCSASAHVGAPLSSATGP